MTPNPYRMAGVEDDDMEKLQLYISLADKKFIDSLVPDRGFKTWAVVLFVMALKHDIEEAEIDCYSPDNEQRIRQIVRNRTAIGPVRKRSKGHDSRGGSGVRKAHAKRAQKSTKSQPST